MQLSVKHPSVSFFFVSGIAVCFYSFDCVYILSESLHQMAVMKKSKFMSWLAIKFLFFHAALLAVSFFCDAKQISIKSLFYEFPLPSKCESSALKSNLTAAASRRASKRSNHIETWLIFLMFSLAIIIGNEEHKKKHFTTRLSEKKLLFCMEIILHKINFNLKSVICAAWITQKQFAVESRINIAWVISIYCTLPHVHLLLQLSGSEWRGPLCRI